MDEVMRSAHLFTDRGAVVFALATRTVAQPTILLASAYPSPE
jgi:hypothetical protein